MKSVRPRIHVRQNCCDDFRLRLRALRAAVVETVGLMLVTLRPQLASKCPLAFDFERAYQAELQYQPDRHAEQRHGDQAFSCPCQLVRLNREDHDGELIRKSRMSENAVFLGKRLRTP